MTDQITLPALTMLGDLLEEKETELSIHGTEEQLENLNELWTLYQGLLS
jgi:hypothetical protein